MEKIEKEKIERKRIRKKKNLEERESTRSRRQGAIISSKVKMKVINMS